MGKRKFLLSTEYPFHKTSFLSAAAESLLLNYKVKCSLLATSTLCTYPQVRTHTREHSAQHNAVATRKTAFCEVPTAT